MRIRAFSLLRKTVAREDTDTTKQSQSEMVSAAKCVLGDTPLGLVRHPPGAAWRPELYADLCGLALLACCAKQLQEKTQIRQNRANQN